MYGLENRDTEVAIQTVRAEGRRKGYTVTPKDGRYVLANAAGDYRGTYDTEDEAWRHSWRARRIA